MGKRFNDVGLCRPSQHYMVNIKGRLEKIKKLIDEGAYFVMNRARQYGKSTTLAALRNYLSNEYTVILLSFQRLSTAKFRDEHTFAVAFAQSFLTFVENKKKIDAAIKKVNDYKEKAENYKKEFDKYKSQIEEKVQDVKDNVDEVKY